MAIALAEAGADVVLWARRESSLKRVAQAIRDRGRRAWTQRVDITDAAQIRRGIAHLRRAAGRLDVLINNAAIWDGDPVATLSPARWQRVLDTDLTAAFRVTQTALPLMLRRRRGSIIHIASTSGILAHPDGAAYGSAKAALIHLTRIMAVELGPHGIRVNAIAPGLFRTDMTADVFADRDWVERRTRRLPLGRFGEPTDLGSVAVFLASPASRHITGQTLVVDGGQSLVTGA